MKRVPTEIEGVYLVRCERFADQRGALDLSFEESIAEGTGIDTHWRQSFVSRTKRCNTVRGLHYQAGEASEAKLLVPLRGQMFWVVVDLRRGSTSFARWTSAILTPDDGTALLVGPGFAHGCLSLGDETELFILSNAPRGKRDGGGIVWNDPDLAIDWPKSQAAPIISDAHAAYPDFAAFQAGRGAL